jgi:hypothetical protein
MKFLLDTDHISILQKQSGPEFAALMARIAQVRRVDLGFCIRDLIRTIKKDAAARLQANREQLIQTPQEQ